MNSGENGNGTSMKGWGEGDLVVPLCTCASDSSVLGDAASQNPERLDDIMPLGTPLFVLMVGLWDLLACPGTL